MMFPEEKLKNMKQNFKGIKSMEPAEWIREAVLYQVYIRNLDEEGTFKSTISHLDRIKELGADTVYLLPIHPIGRKEKKGSLGCPYSIKDYLDVNPEYGTKEDFRLLVEETHKRGMKIIIDMVANHLAHDNVLLEQHPEWFYKDESGNVTRRRTEWSDVIDNDFNDPGFWKYMKEAILYWVREFDIDGYRCDVAGMVPLNFWEEVFADLRKIKPDVYLLAEWGHSNLCTDAFNSDYHSELYWCIRKVRNLEVEAGDLVYMVLQNRLLYPENYLPMNFIENHDRKRASKVLGEKGFMPAASLIFTIPGVPLVYNGQEIGKTRYLSLFDREPIDWKKQNQETLNHYKALIKLRKENRVFTHGEVIPLANSRPDKIASFMVKSEHDCVSVFLNFSPKNINVKVKYPEYLNYRPKEILFQSPKLRKTVELNEKEDLLEVSMKGYGTLVMR